MLRLRKRFPGISRAVGDARREVVDFATLCGFSGAACLTVSGKVCNFVGPRVLTLEYEFETLGTHVSSVHHPIFALFDENHCHEPQRRLA